MLLEKNEIEIIPERDKKSISTGSKILSLGVFQDSYGGDTRYPFGMMMKEMNIAQKVLKKPKNWRTQQYMSRSRCA